MKKTILISAMILSLAACKEEQSKQAAQAPAPAQQTAAAPMPAPVPEKLTIEELAVQSLSQPNDWVGDLGLYLDTILSCTQNSPVPAKYVFKADSFETQDTTLVLFKGQNERVYACSFVKSNSLPEFREIRVAAPIKGERFYPGNLQKVDSCLNNTRILDKNGQTAGWLSRITC